jgi:hypothetical protein
MDVTMRFSPVPTAARAVRLHPFLNVPSYREVQSQLVIELRRARRYEHPLGVTMISLRVPARGPDERQNGHARTLEVDVMPAVYSLLGSYLRNTLRETDILTAAPESLAFATFLPDTDRQGTELALHRFRTGFEECSGYAIDGGVAAFPGDGMTIEDVLDRAYEGWRLSCRPAVPTRLERRNSHG